MKKIFSLFIVAVLALCGCGSTMQTSKEEFDGADYLFYPQENVCAFDVDHNGNVYSVAFNSDVVEIYDIDGAFMEEKSLPTAYTISLKVNENDIYSLSSNILYKNDEIFYTLPFEDCALSLELTGDFAYILYDDYDADVSSSPIIDLLSAWSGEKLLKINITDKTATEVECGYPLLMSAYENKLWLYCCDDNGCYITGYDGRDFTEKAYTDKGKLNSFCAIGDNRFIFPDYSEETTPTISLLQSETKAVNQLMPNVTCFLHGGIKYFGGYIYYINNYGYAEHVDKIERIKESAYAADNTVINVITPKGTMIYEPFGCGRTIKTDPLQADEFALSVLSQDRRYDLYAFSSSSDFSLNVRDKGSFYALNDVEGVSEYIDKCFSSMKNTAVNEDGEIWALPVNLTACCVIYNEKNCIAKGIDVANMSFETLVKTALEMYSENPQCTEVSVDPKAVCELMMLDYLSGKNTDLDSAKFRSLAEYCKNIRKYEGNALNARNTAMQTFGDSLFYIISTDRQEQFNFSTNNDIRAKDLYEGNAPADCVYLCVNPASDNLNAVLEYITALCDYLSNKQDGFSLADKSLYSDKTYTRDLYDIYSHSEIYFRLPDDIISSELEKYINDEISMEEMIIESERKLLAYLNE